MIRVCLIGDVRLDREGLATLIGSSIDPIEVAAHASSADEADLGDESIDVVVVDKDGPGRLQAVRSALDRVGAPVVVLGAPHDDAQVIELAESGVLGFVDGDAPLDELLTGVASAAHNEASFPRWVGTVLLRHVSSPPASAPEIAALTMREREVVRLVAEGLTNKEIALRLSIELATVKNHVHNILEKLQVNGRSEAVARLGI